MRALCVSSFVVKNETGLAVACALTFDVHDEPPVEISSKLSIVFDFLEFIEGPIRYVRWASAAV